MSTTIAADYCCRICHVVLCVTKRVGKARSPGGSYTAVDAAGDQRAARRIQHPATLMSNENRMGGTAHQSRRVSDLCRCNDVIRTSKRGDVSLLCTLVIGDVGSGCQRDCERNASSVLSSLSVIYLSVIFVREIFLATRTCPVCW